MSNIFTLKKALQFSSSLKLNRDLDLEIPIFRPLISVEIATVLSYLHAVVRRRSITGGGWQIPSLIFLHRRDSSSRPCSRFRPPSHLRSRHPPSGNYQSTPGVEKEPWRAASSVDPPQPLNFFQRVAILSDPTFAVAPVPVTGHQRQEAANSSSGQ
ncbi:tRNA synthetase class I (I [Striga asiatica]|uniref:tRNA synthetase class I (I) n=1 Tax=Striga asiatica TaxID=4170 RepID=A0A5A7NXS8_STRAF|nr:tRNA synthetase class I (I [Striga asiatica]